MKDCLIILNMQVMNFNFIFYNVMKRGQKLFEGSAYVISYLANLVLRLV